MTIKSYEDLEVYQRSYRLSLELHRLSFTLPKAERYELQSQIRRAAVSVPLNIAEGYGRKDSPKEFKHFLRNALGSCNEVQVLLSMLFDLGYSTKQTVSSFKEEYTIVGKQLSRLLQVWI